MKKILLKALPMLFVGLLLVVQSMYAQTNYYVNASAVDDSGDGTVGNPKKTIQAAIDLANTGDIINIADGIYSPSGAVSGQFINIIKALTIKGASKAGTIIDGGTANYVTDSNIGFRIAANNVTLQDLTITSFEKGISVGTSISDLNINNIVSTANYRYGFYTNQTVSNVSITNSEFTYNGNKGGIKVGSSARGIMFQSSEADYVNIIVDQNIASNNQLVGIDFAESNYTNGITLTQNTVHGNGDSGIGLWLGKNNLSSGAVLVAQNNIVLDGDSRFGIEIKNVLASGASSGTGSVVVDNNTITQTGTQDNTRDFAAIAVLRRKSGYTDINDQPFGVYLSNNVITDITADEGDGYGIVLGGTGHTVVGNTISGTEIALQLQKGNIGHDGNTDSPSTTNDPNTFYFDRDNSADACAYIGANNLSGNVTDFRFVTGAAVSSAAPPELVAKNNNTLIQFCSIQKAIDAPSTVNGNTIEVYAGTHAEKLTVNKQLTLLGPNAGTAGTDTRVAEAKIIPPTTDIGASAGVMVTFGAGSAGSVFDGFEVNGDNPALTSGTTSGGMDVDASYGIGVEDVGNVTIKNNIVQNFGGSAATPQALAIYVAPSNNAVYSGVVIEKNYVKNVYQSAASAALVGIYVYSNAYSQIKDNKIENVRTGVQFDNPNQANPDAATFEAAIENNDITASRGIYYNLAYNTASPWYVRNNTIRSAPLVAPSTTFIGIRVESIQGTYSGYITDNNIDGQYAARYAEDNTFVGTGIWFNNKVNTTGTLLFKDNDIANVTDGIVYNATHSVVSGVNVKNELTAKVRFVGGNIYNVAENYVHYIIPGGTNPLPDFADINLPSTKLDGKTGEEWNTELGDLSTIYAKIIDKDDDSNFGKVNLLFNVKNLTQGTAFATIQDAIDDDLTVDADIIDVKEGTQTLTTAVKINKQITLQGNNNVLSAKPIITGVGNVTNKALIEIDAPNVTIKNFEFQIAQAGNALIGITTLTTDNFNNLTIADNTFKGMAAYSAGSVWTSYAMKLGRGFTGVNNLVNVVRNIITYANPATPELFGRGIYAFNVYGKIGGAAVDGNVINGVYALQAGEIGGGTGNDFEFSYNQVPLGVLGVVGAEAGNHKINNNAIGSGIANFAQAQNIVRLVEIRGSRTANANIEVAGNTLTNYAGIGLFLQRSNNLTVKDNTFTPYQDAGNTSFYSLVFSSKEGTSGTQSAVTSQNLAITGNTFDGNGSGAGGAGIAFFNHNASAAVKPLTNVKVGGTASDKNTFDANLANYVLLDETASGTTENPLFTTLYDVAQTGTAVTNILPFNADIDAAYNTFGTVNSETSVDFADLVAAKAKIYDGVDNSALGYVNIQPQKAFVNTVADFANAIIVVPDDYTLILKNDAAVYENLGNATLTKAHTFTIDQYVSGEIKFNNFTVDGVGKEITFNNPVNVFGDFTLTAGKINANIQIDAETFSFNSSDPSADYINGKIIVNNFNGGSITLPVGKGTKSSLVALERWGGDVASVFEIEYFPTAYANTTSFDPEDIGAIYDKEYWSIDRISGNTEVRVGLTTLDFSSSGFTSLAVGDAMVVRFDENSSSWLSVGNTQSSVNGNNGYIKSYTTADFGIFTFAKSPSTVLPITLLDFTANATTGGALVKWSTAKEESNAKFEVEKSLDGKNFFVIVSRKGQGNSSTVSNYEFLDVSFKQSAYYRLVQVDAGGKRTAYTDLTKFVKGLDNSLSVIAYPNPVTAKLYVTVGSANKENVKLLLTDLTGKTLKVKNADSTQPIELDVAGIAAGSYILQVVKDSGNVSKKILKL